MKRFYKFKLKYPKYGQDLMPSRVKHVFEEEVMVFMPTRLPTGSRIMLANLGSEFGSLKEIPSEIMYIFCRKVESKKCNFARHVQIGDDGFGSGHD